MSRSNMDSDRFNSGTPIRDSGGGDDDALRQLNSLLRGEISACETYRMAIDNVADSDQAAMDNVSILREIETEHSLAARMLREQIRQLGGNPSDSSGAWGAWAQTVQGTMNLFGDTSSLKALKEGEEHGLKDYEDALKDVDGVSRQFISNKLIPQQQRHLSLLNQLITVVGRA
jgi:uncharacterized protein (TIGR02284 family)